MKTITIAGVPEHFNLPWHLAIEKNKFKKKGIDLLWKDYYGGTGAMCEALKTKQVDIALVLTEGGLKELAENLHSKIVKIYVESPLLWGVHVGKNSDIKNITNLKNATVAISRFGSGSHLMAKVYAHKNNWNPDSLNYKTIKNLNGGINEITSNKNSCFLWEHFTTKPYVDSGQISEIDTIKTPWPCFVMLVRKDVLEKNKIEIQQIIKIINKQLKKIEKKKDTPEIIQLFSEKYNQKPKDIKEWLQLTKWNSKKTISKSKYQKIITKLLEFKVLNNSLKYKNIVENIFD